jgi:DNA polymerase phi
VLDLLEIYVKKQPSSPYIIRLIIPLIEVIAGTGSDERHLSEKATGLLRNRIGKLKETPSSIDLSLVSSVYENLHQRARRASSSEALITFSHCLVYVSRVLLSSQAVDQVRDQYKQSLDDFASRKSSSLNTKFFEEFIQRNLEASWALRDDILASSRNSANVYRRCQLLLLVQQVLKAQDIVS